ncbi:MAG TPA: hypothetical protein VLV83_13915 [Acidobacteriota bacterium]|nr:hypothetical protein [Acidobacteriota bacterium]
MKARFFLPAKLGGVLLLGILMGACQPLSVLEDDPGTDQPQGTGDLPPQASGAPTFSGQVASILYENCTSCHRPGEAAPFPFLTYDQASKRALQIADVTDMGYMPPWQAAQGWGEFKHERRLSRREIEILWRWAEAGAPAGDLSQAPEPPRFTPGWKLGPPDLVLEMEKGYPVTEDGPDIYRHFVLPTGLTQDRYIRAVEFRPGARAVVHHADYFLDVEGQARRFEDREEGVGFASMADADFRARFLAGWAPGANPNVLPEGLAWKLEAGSDIVLQIHFHPSGKPEVERSKLGLYFADQPPQRRFAEVMVPPYFGLMAGLDIAPGENDFVIRDSFTLPVDVEAFAINGHAHYLGKEFKAWAVLPSGERIKLLWIPDWEFGWQEQYHYCNMLPLPAGTRVEAEIHYDNSADNPSNPHYPPRRVTWGPYSFDEMGSVSLMVTPSRSGDFEELQAAIDAEWDRQFERFSNSAETREAFQRFLLQRFDADGDGQLTGREKEEHDAYVADL